jgi:hypothetical protein
MVIFDEENTESRCGPSATEPYLPLSPLSVYCRISAARKKEMYEEWLGPESNRLCLHYSLQQSEWKADTGPPLPSLIYLLLHSYFIVKLSRE